MPLVLVTPPEVEPLTRTEVKARLGITDTASDAAIDAAIAAETDRLDGANGILGRCLITQEWDYIFDGFPSANYKPFGGYRWQDWQMEYWEQGIPLPLGPVQEITSVTYRDTDGVEQTVDEDDYRLIGGMPALVHPVTDFSWPTSEYVRRGVTVRFIAGYGDAGSDVPEAIRSAIVARISAGRSLFGRDLTMQSRTAEGLGTITYSGSSISQGTSVLYSHADSLLRPFMPTGIS